MGAGRRYTSEVPKRDPYDVLGVARGADAAEIKAAWRRLARAHHPDLTGDDPAASQVATRQMAEINDAYAALIRDMATERHRMPDRPPTWAPTAARAAAARLSPGRRGRSPAGWTRPRPTGRAIRRLPRSPGGPYPNPDNGLRGQPPLRGERAQSEMPRASTPTGPLERGRIRNFRRPKPPDLDGAREHVIEFGKFHGHTLGQIAAFEPSYIDWVVSTVTRDPGPGRGGARRPGGPRRSRHRAAESSGDGPRDPLRP